MYILNSFVASSRTFSNFADDKYYVHTVASHKHSTKFNVHSVIFLFISVYPNMSRVGPYLLVEHTDQDCTKAYLILIERPCNKSQRKHIAYSIRKLLKLTEFA